MALVGTLTGITLGLLIGSAKTYYDTPSNELRQVSANVHLASFRLKPARRPIAMILGLRSLLARSIEGAGPKGPLPRNSQPAPKAGRIQEVYEQLRALAPKDEEHRNDAVRGPRSAQKSGTATLADY